MEQQPGTKLVFRNNDSGHAGAGDPRAETGGRASLIHVASITR